MDVLQVCVPDWHVWSGWSNACHHLVLPGCPASEEVTAPLHVLPLPTQAREMQCEVKRKDRVRRVLEFSILKMTPGGQQKSLV